MNNVDNTPAPLDIYGILLMTIHTKKNPTSSIERDKASIC